MSRARTWLLAGGVTLGALLAVALGLLAWLLYTPSGLHFVLDRGVVLMHGQFAYARASGTLAGTTTISGLDYRDAGGDSLHIEHASLAVRPWALLARRFEVTRARIDGVALDLTPAKDASQAAGFSLKPPLTLALNDVVLSRISVRQAGKRIFVADRLALAGLWSASQLVVRSLALTAPAGTAQLSGTLAIAAGYHGRGQGAFDWTRDGTRYAGHVTSRSDGTRARIHVALATPIRGSAEASIQLDATHAWTFALVAPAFDARAVPALPVAVKTLALDLHGAGNPHGGKLTGNVVLNGYAITLDPAAFRIAGKVLTLDPVQLRSLQVAGGASITGSVHLDATPMSFALDTRWQGVRLPAELAGQVLATHGQLHLQGNTSRFALRGALAVGPPGRLTNVEVDLAGTPDAVDLHAVQLVQKHGGLVASGHVGLKMPMSWKLDVVAKRFDPGAILAGWNGALDFHLVTTGRLTADGAVATFKLDRARGTLRQRNIAGSTANLEVAPGNLLQGTAQLVIGTSRIAIRGTHGAKTDASVMLHIPSLGDWMPGASGHLQGQFTLKGAWPKLAIAGQLRGADLHVGPRSIASLQLAVSAPDLAKPGGEFDLNLGGVHASGFAFDEVHLKGGGNAGAHHVQLAARGPQLGVALTLDGRWQPAAKRWTATLAQVVLTPHGIPAWRQRQPATITWQRGALSLSQLCLAAGAPELCLSASRSARGVISAKYTLERLPLQLLASLADARNALTASGEISGAGELLLSASQQLGGHAELNIGAGSIAYATSAGQPLVAWSSVRATLAGTGTSQQLTLRGALNDGGQITGEATLAGPRHALTGTLSVDLKNLAPLSVLSTEVANVKGSLSGELALAGTLAAPRFQGRIATRDFSAELPRAGLKLHDGEFAITGDSEGRLTLHGQLTSGRGVLHIDGHAGLTSASAFELDIKGENVLVADIPAARVIASPDLVITRSGNAFRLTGSVTIPEARLAVEKLPGQGSVRASPDVVIVDAPPATAVTPLAIQADMDVKLGDKVKVQGYGFDGSAQGQLAVHVAPGQTATGRGEIRISGKYQAYGQDLTIEQGRLSFAGTRLDDPGLDIRAVRQIRSQSVTVGISIRGTARRPVLTVFSDPAMEQAEALSYLVTGRPLNDLRSGEGDTLDTAAQALGGLAGDRIAKSIGTRLGLEAGVSSSEALGGSAFTAGKYLSPRLFLSYGVGLFTPGQVVTLRYTLNRFLQFEAENATTGTRASLNYRIEK